MCVCMPALVNLCSLMYSEIQASHSKGHIVKTRHFWTKESSLTPMCSWCQAPTWAHLKTKLDPVPASNRTWADSSHFLISENNQIHLHRKKHFLKNHLKRNTLVMGDLLHTQPLLWGLHLRNKTLQPPVPQVLSWGVMAPTTPDTPVPSNLPLLCSHRANQVRIL